MEAFKEEMAERYDRYAACGIVSIVVGFVLQMIGIWLPAFLLG